LRIGPPEIEAGVEILVGSVPFAGGVAERGRKLSEMFDALQAVVLEIDACIADGVFSPFLRTMLRPTPPVAFWASAPPVVMAISWKLSNRSRRRRSRSRPCP